MNLREVLQDFFLQQQKLPPQVIIGLSGGLDSTVLLAVIADLRVQFPLNCLALHVHHGLHPAADQWALHCQQLAAQLDIPFLQSRISVQPQAGESIENFARRERYAIFHQHLQQEALLLTAHHQDDQAETLLLQLLRGSGVKGLAAMPTLKPCAGGWHGRPFLQVPRAQLMQYAQQHQLTWLDDDANANEKFTRNFLRHQILPVLKQRWPMVTRTLTRVAEHCGEAQTILTQVGRAQLASAQGSQPGYLSVTALRHLTPQLQRLVLREWILQFNFLLPETCKLLELQRQLLIAAVDRGPHVCWGDYEIRRYQDDLILQSQIAPTTITPLTWHLAQPLQLAQGKLQAQSQQLAGFLLSEKLQQVEVRFRRGGEKCVFAGKYKHKTLKNLLQQWRIPPWDRAQLPLLYFENILVAIPGYYLHPEFCVRDQSGWLITYQKN